MFKISKCLPIAFSLLFLVYCGENGLFFPPSLPLILYGIVAAGIDLQLSVHTHHGQMWPLNYMTSQIYRISRGYEQIGKTHLIVSSGYGTW